MLQNFALCSWPLRYESQADFSTCWRSRHFKFTQALITCDVRATTAQLYPDRDTFDFDEGHVTKNQPITMFVLLSESLGI